MRLLHPPAKLMSVIRTRTQISVNVHGKEIMANSKNLLYGIEIPDEMPSPHRCLFPIGSN